MVIYGYKTSSVLPLALILESVTTLPHRITLEQTFYSDQGKGSRRVSYKATFPVKPFRQRREEQDCSRQKSDQTTQDKLVKIAEISKEFLPASGENSFVPR